MRRKTEPGVVEGGRRQAAAPTACKAGRPSKLTGAGQATIVAALERGNFQLVAAEVAGIDVSTFTRWMDRGRKPGDAQAPFRAFRAAVLVANAKCQDVQLARINRAASRGTWQAAAWILERRFPEQWGRKMAQPTDGADAFAAFLDEVARKRAEHLQKSSGDTE